MLCKQEDDLKTDNSCFSSAVKSPTVTAKLEDGTTTNNNNKQAKSGLQQNDSKNEAGKNNKAVFPNNFMNNFAMNNGAFNWGAANPASAMMMHSFNNNNGIYIFYICAYINCIKKKRVKFFEKKNLK